MPLWVTSRTIAIAHPILIREILARDIGQISLELMEWLKDKLYLQEAIEAGHDNTVGERIRGFRDYKVQDWNDRCLLAAMRGYRPTFVDSRGELTKAGMDKAQMIRDFYIDAINWQRDHPPQIPSDYDPARIIPMDELPIARMAEKQFWTKAEHCFLSMEITKRQYSMLRMLQKALAEAEATNRTRLDEKYMSARSAQMLDELGQIDENLASQEEVARLNALRATNTVTSIFDEIASLGVSQSFQAVMLNAHPEYDYLTPDLSRPKPKLEPYVPTAMFGQRARNDLNVLVKYGLVDLKAFHTGVRGRPRHIVRVSEVGTVLINDPELQAEL